MQNHSYEVEGMRTNSGGRCRDLSSCDGRTTGRCFLDSSGSPSSLSPHFSPALPGSSLTGAGAGTFFENPVTS